MKLKNTSRYDNRTVRLLVKFASKGINHKGISVWVKNSKYSFRGRAYQSLWGKPHCVVAIGKPSCYPRTTKYPRLKTAPSYTLNNWQEALVVVVAHELYHQKQYSHKWPASEIRAERWAVKMLERYRTAGV